MRIAPDELIGKRSRFAAIVARFGSKPGFDNGPPRQTMLVRDVVEAQTGGLVCRGVWLTCGKWSAGLDIGDRFAFDARVTQFLPEHWGYEDRLCNLRLERPTKMVIIEKAEAIG